MEVNISSHVTLSGGRRRLALASGEEYVYVSTLTTIRYSNCPRLLSRLVHPTPTPSPRTSRLISQLHSPTLSLRQPALHQSQYM